MSLSRPALFLMALLPLGVAADEGLLIAVASNFRAAAEEIATEFSGATRIPVRISSGSTGMLYAQIVNGAPYDIFLAADAKRPRLLENDALAVSGSRLTYATGSLVLWSADSSLTSRDCFEVLKSGAYRRIAIANPLTAPYGAAAEEFLKATGVYEEASERMVYGENIAQTLQFVASGNATLGLIAAAQVADGLPQPGSCKWSVPVALHSVIDQQAVVLQKSKNLVAAHQFMEFLQTPEVAVVLTRRGYGVPE